MTTTNINYAADIIATPLRPIIKEYADGIGLSRAKALANAGLLIPELRVVHTLDELKTLDLHTLLYMRQSNGQHKVYRLWEMLELDTSTLLPAVIIATGDHILAAHYTLET